MHPLSPKETPKLLTTTNKPSTTPLQLPPKKIPAWPTTSHYHQETVMTNYHPEKSHNDP